LWLLCVDSSLVCGARGSFVLCVLEVAVFFFFS